MRTTKKRILKHAATSLSAVITALSMATSAYADGPKGYAVDSSDSVVRTGSGGCLHTPRWNPELRITECGGQPVATAPAPETEHAAFEPQAKPLETMTLDANTLFAFDKATLRPQARERLDELTQRMHGQVKLLSVNVTGHADRIGDSDYNKTLSEQRAETVADYLQQLTDLRDAEFRVQGVGESQPVVECSNTGSSRALIQCLAPNRRVEVEVSLQQQADVR